MTLSNTQRRYLHKVVCMRDKVFADPWPPERGDEPTIPYYRAALAQLLHELTSRDEYEYADTWWWDERTVGFWGRRMAHEAAIHRVDVEQAHADVTPIDQELALDGVDEVLRLFLAGDWRTSRHPSGRATSCRFVPAVPRGGFDGAVSHRRQCLPRAVARTADCRHGVG